MSVTTHKDELSDNITLFEQQIKRLQSAIDYELETKTKSDILADQVHEKISLASPAIATVEEPSTNVDEQLPKKEEQETAVKSNSEIDAIAKRKELNKLRQEKLQQIMNYNKLLAANSQFKKEQEQAEKKQAEREQAEREQAEREQAEAEQFEQFQKYEHLLAQAKMFKDKQLIKLEKYKTQLIDINERLKKKKEQLIKEDEMLKKKQGSNVFLASEGATEKEIEELNLKRQNLEEDIRDIIGEIEETSGGKKTRKRKPVHDTRKRIKKIRCKPSTSKANESTSRRCRP